MIVLKEDSDNTVVNKIRKLETFLSEEGIVIEEFGNKLFITITDGGYQLEVLGSKIPRWSTEEKLAVTKAYRRV